MPEKPAIQEESSVVKRALPIATTAPTQDWEFAAWQVALERRHFSCGTIDGEVGSRSTKAILNFQKNQRLPLTGILDDATRLRLGKPGEPFAEYIVTSQDMALVRETPQTWKAKSKVSYLGYNDGWEMMAEKCHATANFLKKLNSEIEEIEEGVALLIPNLESSEPLPKAGRVEIILSERTLLVFDASNRLVACFPCSIASQEEQRPMGELKVIVKVLDPEYTFDPKMFSEAARAEGIKSKLLIPRGPNNPVGLAWMGLSLPGYGMHGTPDPQHISATGSHGCFRLANWNALKLYQMVQEGTSVWVRE
ncbi:MAG: L,D-transpeptidase family protein [Verrucomicrobiota bacterium]